MATGDAVPGSSHRSFTNSVCHPCSEENIQKSADKYCLQCDMYMCVICLNLHNKFPPNRAHNVTGAFVQGGSKNSETASSVRSNLSFTSDFGQISPGPSFAFEKCMFHQEEKINVYCGKHDVVCCSFCIAVDHRDCDQNQIKYIRNIDFSSKESERVDVIEDVKSILDDLDKTMKSRFKDRERLEKDQAQMKKVVKDHQEKLTRKLEEAVKNTLTQIDVHYGKLSAAIETDINLSMEACNSLQTILSNVPKNTDDDIEKFIFIKYGKKSAEIKKAETNDIKKRIGKEKLFFTPNEQIKKLFGFLSTLGDVAHTLQPFEDKNFHYTASIRNEVRFSRRLDIVDVCQLQDGQKVVADKSGCRVARLNSSLDFSDECPCFREPTALCAVNPNEVAVALEQGQYGSIAIILLKPDKMTMTRAFFVGPVCHGIVYDGGLFYVTTGGKFMMAFGSHIRVFNTFGIFVKTIKSDLSIPMHIKCVGEAHNTCFYLATEKDGLIQLDRDGRRTAAYKHKSMKKTTVLSSSNDNIVFILDNSNVFHLVSGQESPQLILKGADFKPSVPKSILYDSTNRKLAVFTDKEVKEYDLLRQEGADGKLSLSRH